jgi:uncharacterized protein (DUF1697 family)
MAGRHVPVHDLRELLRHLQLTASDSAVQRTTGLNRRTIARYRAWATAQGLGGMLKVVQNGSLTSYTCGTNTPK